MRHTSCLFSPARALHRVFLSDLLLPPSTTGPATRTITTTSPSPHLPSSRLLKPTTTTTTTPSVTRSGVPTIRTLSTTAPLSRLEKPPNAKRGNKEIINGDIPYKWVRIAHPETRELSPPRRTDTVLASLDRKTHTLVMVAPPPTPKPAETFTSSSPGEGEEDEGKKNGDDAASTTPAEGRGAGAATAGIIQGPPAAICRIIDREAEAAKSAEAAKLARRRNVNTKELELNWAIAPNDLEHKLRQLERFLGKGMAVDVMLARKRRGRAAGRDEAEAVLDKVRERVAAVPGAQERKKMDGAVGGVAKLFFEGPQGKKLRALQEQGHGQKQGQEEGGDEK